MSKKKILLYGGLSTSFIVHENLIEQNKKINFIFDEYIKKINFQTKAKFSNKKKDLKLFLKKADFFFNK